MISASAEIMEKPDMSNRMPGACAHSFSAGVSSEAPAWSSWCRGAATSDGKASNSWHTLSEPQHAHKPHSQVPTVMTDMWSAQAH